MKKLELNVFEKIAAIASHKKLIILVASCPCAFNFANQFRELSGRIRIFNKISICSKGIEEKHARKVHHR